MYFVCLSLCVYVVIMVMGNKHTPYLKTAVPFALTRYAGQATACVTTDSSSPLLIGSLIDLEGTVFDV